MPAPSGVYWLILFSAAGPRSDEGKVRPCRASISLLAIWTSSLRILSSWLLTSAWSIKLISIGSSKNSSILTWDEFSELVASKTSGMSGPELRLTEIEAFRQVWSRLRVTEIGNTGRQNQQDAASDRDRNVRFFCFVFDKLNNWFIRLVLDVLSEDLQLPIADQCLVDQSRKHRIIEKLFSPALR